MAWTSDTFRSWHTHSMWPLNFARKWHVSCLWLLPELYHLPSNSECIFLCTDHYFFEKFLLDCIWWFSVNTILHTTFGSPLNEEMETCKQVLPFEQWEILSFCFTRSLYCTTSSWTINMNQSLGRGSRFAPNLQFSDKWHNSAIYAPVPLIGNWLC